MSEVKVFPEAVLILSAFHWLVICLWIRPEIERKLKEKITALLQLGFRPFVTFLQELVQTQRAVTEAVLGVLLLDEPLVEIP